MITGKQDEIIEMCKVYECPEHPSNTLTCSYQRDGSFVVRCGAGHFPEEITPLATPRQAASRGQAVPLYIKALGLPGEDLGSKAKLTEQQLKMLCDYAAERHLDARSGHVALMYGQPYITIDGYLYHANRSVKKYSLRSRPLSFDEKLLWQLLKDDHAWICEVDVNNGEIHAAGIGIVTQEEMTRMSERHPTELAAPVVAAHPWQMAQKRAEWQACKRAFPIAEVEDEQKTD